MKKILLAAAVLTAVAGCNSEVEAEDEGDAVEEPAAPAPANAADSGKPGGNAATADNGLRSWLIGRWGDNGSCEAPITMREDGTFVNADGSGGRWSLDGDRLTLTGTGSLTVILIRDGDNAMTLRHMDGSIGHSIRC